MQSASATSIVILNGTTCAGKTTTAEALIQLLCNERMRAVHLGIDDVMKLWDSSRYEVFKNKAKDIGLPPTSIFADVFSQEIISLAEKNEFDFIVVDHCFRYYEMFCNTLLRFSRFEVFFIKVHCTYEKATERLKRRNLIPGSERVQHLVDLHFRIKNNFECLQNKPDEFFPTIHNYKMYDLEIDTTYESPESCASQINSFILTCNPYHFRSHMDDPFWCKKIRAYYTTEIIDKLKLGF